MLIRITSRSGLSAWLALLTTTGVIAVSVGLTDTLAVEVKATDGKADGTTGTVLTSIAATLTLAVSLITGMGLSLWVALSPYCQNKGVLAAAKPAVNTKPGTAIRLNVLSRFVGHKLPVFLNSASNAVPIT